MLQVRQRTCVRKETQVLKSVRDKKSNIFLLTQCISKMKKKATTKSIRKSTAVYENVNLKYGIR